MKRKPYRRCAVPECINSSLSAPDKLYIDVPHKADMRKKWFQIARRKCENISMKSSMFFCEDHFDLPTDMSNYIRYRVMGSVKKIMMRPGCVPTKFDCQKSRTDSVATTSDAHDETQTSTTHQESLDGTELRADNEINKIMFTNSGGRCPMIEIPLSSKQFALPADRLAGYSQESVVPAPDSVSHLSMEVDIKTEIEDEVTDNTSLYCEEVDSPGQITEPQGEESLFKGQQCSVCDTEIVGFRYTCVQCSDLDLCGACEARGEHRHHYVLRVPADRPAEEIQSVLATIRVHLMKDLDPIAGLEPDPGKSIKLEIKTEDEEEIGNMSAHEEDNVEAAPDVSAPRTKVFDESMTVSKETNRNQNSRVQANCSTIQTMTSDEQPAEEPHGSISQPGVKTNTHTKEPGGSKRKIYVTTISQLQNMAKGKKIRVLPAGNRNVDVSTVLSAESLSAGNFKILQLPLRPTTGLDHASLPGSEKSNSAAENKR